MKRHPGPDGDDVRLVGGNVRPIGDGQEVRGWGRNGDALLEWVPYVLLAVSAVVAQMRPEAMGPRLITLALAVVAGAWVFVLFTRSPRPRARQRVRMTVYFVGFLALASILMVRNPLFFIFAITGFFHASMLRPWPVTVAGVAATSIAINTIITGFPWPSAELWVLYGAIILIQTLAIGLGTVAGERMAELSEQRRRAVVDLQAALDENAGLQRQLLAQAREAGVLDERARMAREIHDTIAHGLVGVVTQLEAAEQAADQGGAWRRHVENAARLARESLAEARRSVEASRPQPLEGATLEAALGDVAERWSDLNGVPVEFATTGDAVPLDPEIEVALLRTAQEALANVSRHAAATRVGLTLSYMGDEVTLDIRDNGAGFDANGGAGRPGGFGLTAMRQRVGRVAGTLAIESEPGSGTAVSARVPAIAAPTPSPGP